MAADIGSPYHLLFFFFLLMLPPQYLFDLLPLRLVQMGEVRHWRQGGSSACCGHHARVDLSSCIFKSRYRCYEYTRFNINIHRYIQSGQRKTALGILLTFYIFFFQFFLPRYSHYQNCMIFILSNDLQLVENVIVEIICEISVIYFATLTMRHLLNIYVKTANHLPGCSWRQDIGEFCGCTTWRMDIDFCSFIAPVVHWDSI